MKYPEGQDIQVGDLVWWDERACLGHIQVIAESPNDFESWGLDEPHIFLDNHHPFDASIGSGMALPIGCLEDEAVGLLTAEEVIRFESAKDFARTAAKADFRKHDYSVLTECVAGKMVCWIFMLKSGDSTIEEIRVPWVHD